jgi:hypothetical protein
VSFNHILLYYICLLIYLAQAKARTVAAAHAQHAQHAQAQTQAQTHAVAQCLHNITRHTHTYP